MVYIGEKSQVKDDIQFNKWNFIQNDSTQR